MTNKVQAEPPGPDTGAGDAHVCEDDLAKAKGPGAPRKLSHRYTQRLVDESVALYEKQTKAMLDEIIEELSR